jgi:hypothetical protein
MVFKRGTIALQLGVFKLCSNWIENYPIVQLSWDLKVSKAVTLITEPAESMKCLCQKENSRQSEDDGGNYLYRRLQCLLEL